MRFDILTIFPNFFAGPLDHGILSRAIATGAVDVTICARLRTTAIAPWMTGRSAAARAWC